MDFGFGNLDFRFLDFRYSILDFDFGFWILILIDFEIEFGFGDLDAITAISFDIFTPVGAVVIPMTVPSE